MDDFAGGCIGIILGIIFFIYIIVAIVEAILELIAMMFAFIFSAIFACLFSFPACLAFWVPVAVAVFLSIKMTAQNKERKAVIKARRRAEHAASERRYEAKRQLEKLTQLRIQHDQVRRAILQEINHPIGGVM